MKQQAFEERYTNVWTQFQKILKQYDIADKAVFNTKKNTTDDDLKDDFTRVYRRLCHLQAVAHKREYSTHLLDKLDNLALRGYQILYQPKPGTLKQFMEFVLFGFPQTFRQEYKLVITATLVFYLPALAFFLAILVDPQLIYALLPPADVTNMEDMYNPANRVFGSGRDSNTDLQMFGHYISNNIGIAFRTFASGLFLGLGSIFILITNGLVFGGVSAHMINMHYESTFFSFVIGHGSFELTAITIAGAAGMKIGFSLLSPGQYSRSDALLRASKIAVRLVGGAGVMLFVAAFIEGYRSSSSTVLPAVKFVTGTLLWILVFCYLLLSGKRRELK